MAHPSIVRAGFAADPVFGKRTTLDGMSEGTREWIETRYKKTCPGCARRYFTSPKTLPVCQGCWSKVPLDSALKWWKSGTQKVLEQLLDEFFDGGFEVAPDAKQVIV
jgi:hypothetical protein